MEIPFESLKVSTSTQLIYFNGIVDWERLFDNIKPTPIMVPQIKKQKIFADEIIRRTLSAINRKAIRAPVGSIISVGKGSNIKGMDLEKKKKIKCNICQSEEMKCKKLARKVVIPTAKFDCPGYEIKFECVRCNRIYDPIEFGKGANFRNQTSIHMTPNGFHFLHMMVFKNCIKIAGGKAVVDTLECVKRLWYNYVLPSRSYIPISEISSFPKIKSSPAERAPETPKGVPRSSDQKISSFSKTKFSSNQEIKIILERGEKGKETDISNRENEDNFLVLKCRTGMMNFDFEIGFTIDKDKLDRLVSTGKFSDMIALCTRDNTSSSNTNVNIKMIPDLTDKRYPSMIVDLSDSSGKSFSHHNLVDYKISKKVPKTEPSVTFIVFSSGKTILTGINYLHMKTCYLYFLKMMKENRALIEEKINNVVVDIDALLSTEKEPF